MIAALPPLLRIAERRKVGPRKAAAIRSSELSLHISIATILRDHCLPDWMFTHIPSGEARNIRTAAKLKAMGVRRGWPDLLLISPEGRPHFMELKRPGARLTADQASFLAWCRVHDVQHAVCRTIDEALTTFDSWSCLRIRVSAAGNECAK